MSPSTLTITKASSITSHTTSPSSGIKRKNPPLPKQMRKSPSKNQQVYANKKNQKDTYKGSLKEVTIIIDKQRKNMIKEKNIYQWISAQEE